MFSVKSDLWVWLLKSRRSFWHQDRPHCHSSYLYDICVIWHKMSYYDIMTHMTFKYDVGQIGRSWCLNDRLDFSNHTCRSDFNVNIYLRWKKLKMCRKFFPFINFENPLYFLLKNIDFREALPMTSQRRNLCFWNL